MVGNRIVSEEAIILDNGELWCNKNTSGPLYTHYCPGGSNDTSDACEYFHTNTVNFTRGIPGLASGVFLGKVSLK